MLKKNLKTIMGTFHKAKTDLSAFIEQNAREASVTAIKISQLEELNEGRLKESQQARNSLAKIEEILGE